MLSEIFMQINLILTKLRQLKLGGPAIMPHRIKLFKRGHIGGTTYQARRRKPRRLFLLVGHSH